MDSTNNIVRPVNLDSLLSDTSNVTEKAINTFKSMKEVRKANKAIGHFFFERKTMKFWDTKVETPLYRGRYFVTSEANRPPKQGRSYQVHEVLTSGVILNVGPKLGSLDDAKDACKDLGRLTPKAA